MEMILRLIMIIITTKTRYYTDRQRQGYGPWREETADLYFKLQETQNTSISVAMIPWTLSIVGGALLVISPPCLGFQSSIQSILYDRAPLSDSFNTSHSLPFNPLTITQTVTQHPHSLYFLPSSQFRILWFRKSSKWFLLHRAGMYQSVITYPHLYYSV